MKFCSILLSALSALLLAAATFSSAQTPNPHIKNATAIGEVFAEGEKITTAILEYDQEMNSEKLSASAFSVKDRKITKVYANTAASKASTGSNGRFVVLELDPSDPEAAILGGMRDRPSGDNAQAGPGGPGGPGAPGGPAGGNRGGGGMPGGGGGARKPVKLTLAQIAEIVTAKGGKIPGSTTSFETNLAKNLIVDDFQQLNWSDPVTGKTVMYNLFLPKGYDKNKSYPMVLFMHDASVDSPDHDRTLIQGLGAIVWATPEDQAKHPSFVLATQFNGGARPGGPGGPGGPGQGSGGLEGVAPGGPDGRRPGATSGQGLESADTADLVYRLVNHLTGEYNIDKNRMYTTGQSAGCIISLALMVKYPDLFAAAMPVAGQQDPQATSVLKNKKMWIVVSEGDLGAYPGMSASIAVWEKEGSKVVKGTWSARESASVQAANVANMAAEHNNIMFTAFIKGTTLPSGMESSGASEHLTSMRYAYAISGIRDWLFAQSKAQSK